MNRRDFIKKCLTVAVITGLKPVVKTRELLGEDKKENNKENKQF
mgnify:CR=1 FL=1